MPLQTDITLAVAGCKYITTVDATSFFHQFRVKREDRHKLSVILHQGREQYNVALMGFKNAPAYAQRQIDTILREAGCKEFAKAYIDDIVVFSKTSEEHLQHLRRIFETMSQRQLTLAGAKSYIGFPLIALLGQHVDGLGLATAEDKIAAISALAFPITLRELEIYLGMTGWLRHFIPYYAQLAEPLQIQKTTSLKKAPTAGHARKHFAATSHIEPTAELLDAFNAMQKEFANRRMLVHYQRQRPLYVFIDASKQRGFGVFVAHLTGDAVTASPPRTKVEPILFLSKTLTPAERRYWPTELEVACLVWTVKRIRWMIEASEHTVTVLTDHAATMAIVKQTGLSSSSVDKLNNRLTRASQYLAQFHNLNVVYVPGREHIVPDALSRLTASDSNRVNQEGNVLEDLVMSNLTETLCFTTTILEIQPQFKAQLQTAYDDDKHFSRLKALATNTPGQTSF